MAFGNYNNKEITVKIVYYGPALSGKTTCLRHIYQKGDFGGKGKLITLDTDGDRTLFFDFLPLELGKLGGYTIKIQLYTVPGQVAYDTTRKLVLQGADAVVFVCDSQREMVQQNQESFNNLKQNLRLNNIAFHEIPLVLHYNKRDLRDILSIDDMNRLLNTDNRPFFPTIATSGENVMEGLQTVIRQVLIYLKNKLSIFQKDKTVMFSREEVTRAAARMDQAPPAPEKTLVKPATAGAAFQAGLSASDPVLELSSPMMDDPVPQAPSFEEPIFSLEEDFQAPLDDDFEVPEYDERPTHAVPFPKGASNDDQTGGWGPSPVHNGVVSEVSTPRTDSGAMGHTLDVPLQITLAPGQTELTLNLTISVKLNRE